MRVIRSKLVRVIRINSIILDLQPAGAGKLGSCVGARPRLKRGGWGHGMHRTGGSRTKEILGSSERGCRGGSGCRSAAAPSETRGGGASRAAVSGTPTAAAPLKRRFSAAAGPGLVPEPALQGAAHEAAERAGCAAPRLLPQPAQDAAAGRSARARRAHPQRTLLLLRRWVNVRPIPAPSSSSSCSGSLLRLWSRVLPSEPPQPCPESGFLAPRGCLLAPRALFLCSRGFLEGSVSFRGIVEPVQLEKSL